MNFDCLYNKYLDFFNKSYKETIENFNKIPNTLKDSMIYATVDGGKRIRPILCLATADFLGVDLECVKPFAIALEFIHSYSLVHDDLPCMDNDDYRRGKLSTHKKFGEAIGVLTGDALLSYAFELCLAKEDFTSCDAKALKVLADYSGYSGMITGQVLDLENEKNNLYTEQLLNDIYINKTSKLLTAPLLIASALSNGKHFEELKEFGFKLGLMFQICDDILDEEGALDSIGKTPHKDKEVDKLTSIKVYGLEGAKAKAKQYYNQCKELLGKIDNSLFLQEFLEKIYIRKK